LEEPPTVSEHVPDEVFEFDSIETMDVLASPLRLRLSHCFRTPATAAEAAERLGVPVTRLYHHINRLLEHGILVVVEERPKGAMTERVFGIAANSFRPSTRFRERYGPEGEAEVVRLAFRTAEAEMTASFESEGMVTGRTSLALSRLSLREEDIPELVERMNALVREFGDRDGDLAVGFFHAVYSLGEAR